MHVKILIPKYNEYPFEEAKKWAKGSYRRARAQVNRKRAKQIKEGLPIETADHAEKMTFIFWRLTGPAPGRPAKEAPLEILLDCLKPHIIQGKWDNFKREFTKHLTKAFEAIHNSNYLPSMVKDRNEWINEVLANFADEVNIHLEFVTHPETVESYNSPRFIEIRNAIWAHFVGETSDYTKPIPSTIPIPGRPVQMEMHLDLSITE